MRISFPLIFFMELLSMLVSTRVVAAIAGPGKGSMDGPPVHVQKLPCKRPQEFQELPELSIHKLHSGRLTVQRGAPGQGPRAAKSCPGGVQEFLVANEKACKLKKPLLFH